MEKLKTILLGIVFLLLMGTAIYLVGKSISIPTTSKEKTMQLETEQIMLIYSKGYLQGALNCAKNDGINWDMFVTDSLAMQKFIEQ